MRIVFTRTKGLFAWAIRVFTGHCFNHVHLEMDNKWCWEANKSKGVVCLPRPEYTTITDMASFKLILDLDQQVELTYWLLQQRGKPYDWKGILGCLLGVSGIHSSGAAWYCSHLLSEGLRKNTRYGPVLAEGNITPKQLYEWCCRNLA